MICCKKVVDVTLLFFLYRKMMFKPLARLFHSPSKILVLYNLKNNTFYYFQDHLLSLRVCVKNTYYSFNLHKCSISTCQCCRFCFIDSESIQASHSYCLDFGGMWLVNLSKFRVCLGFAYFAETEIFLLKIL